MTQPAQDGKLKVCPLDRRTCLGQDCAVWVSLIKHCENPLIIKTYEGCGLVATVPWRLENRHLAAKGEEGNGQE